jgi:mono/diheme cytochrome c family protein
MKLPHSNDATVILAKPVQGIRQTILLLSITTALLSANSVGQNARAPQQAQNHPNQSGEARGKYIVEDLSRCGQCHTPRDDKGNPDRSRWLQGAAVWLKSAEPVGDWPLQAPRIGGALPGTDEEMVKLLTTGVWNTGKYLRPPMPQFRMTREDAEAVIAYLKSVQPGSK